MTWSDLSADDQEAEMRSMGRFYPPGSAGAAAFGLQYDEATKAGVEHGLTGPQMMAAARMGMKPAEYAGWAAVRNAIDAAAEALVQR